MADHLKLTPELLAQPWAKLTSEEEAELAAMDTSMIGKRIDAEREMMIVKANREACRLAGVDPDDGRSSVEKLGDVLEWAKTHKLPEPFYDIVYGTRAALEGWPGPKAAGGPALPAGGLSGTLGLGGPSGRPEPSYERLGAGDVVTAPERPASPPTKRKRKLFYGWRAGDEWRVSLVPPDGPHRPSVGFESVAGAEEWADRKRADVWWER